MSELKGQVGVVTGATSGIGRAVALALARAGACVCLVGRNEAALVEVATEARLTAAAITSHRVDLTRDADVTELCASLERDHGRVDVLVHAAGVISPGELAVADAGLLDWHYQTNLRAPWLLTRATLPLLRASQGQVVFVNSTAGLRAGRTVGAYAATKHALRAFADTLRDEVNGDGVRVTSVFVGRTATPMQARLHRLERRPYRPASLLQPDDVARVVMAALALPRTAEVTDLTIRPLRKPGDMH